MYQYLCEYGHAWRISTIRLPLRCPSLRREPRHSWWASDSLGYFDYRFEVARTRNRETGFDHIHPQLLQYLGHLNLLDCVQLASRHLFSIAQGGVKNIYSVVHHL